MLAKEERNNSVLNEKEVLKIIREDPFCLKKFEMTESNCCAAVEMNGNVLELIPKEKQTSKVCLGAVKQNGLALKFVPPAKKTAVLCREAVGNNALALEFVPKRHKTEKICVDAINADWRAIQFVQQPEYDVGSAVLILERILCSENSDDEKAICNIVRNWKNDLLLDGEIIRLLRKLKVRVFTLKAYMKDMKVFRVREEIKYSKEIEETDFSSFEEFYAYLEGNMENAELHDFDFCGVDLKEYNIDGAYINSDVLISNGLYDDTFYKNAVGKFDDMSNLSGAKTDESILVETLMYNLKTCNLNVKISYQEAQRKVYYISDIHLNHRLRQVFPQHATEQEITRYIRKLIRNMYSHINLSIGDYMLVAGDVSFNLDIAKRFYECLVEEGRSVLFLSRNIVVILGNHEIWDWGGETCTPVRNLEGVVKAYRQLCHELGIRFLHNDLFYLDGKMQKVIDEDHLREIGIHELRRLCLKSSLTILGGLGYSGLAAKYNAEAGLYRQNLQTMAEDVRQSKRFEELYLKVSEALNDQSVVVLTHTPKENWTNEEYNSNWIYVNGHTHHNEFCCSEEKKVYADNQIGYDSSVPVYLKHFSLKTIYDIFRDYADGIYTITREEYLDFGCGQNIQCSFNRTNGVIRMLKRNKIYCFLFRDDNNTLYLLNGGRIKKMSVNSEKYYYERMVCYYYAVEGMFEKYVKALDCISDYIKRIGGTGTIHGCIVDIDKAGWGKMSSHVYLNPYDGTLSFYSATSIKDKWFYESFGALLQDASPSLYPNYEKLVLAEGKDPLDLKDNIVGNVIAEFVSDTSMYKPSRIIRSVQYMRESWVIRIWNDKVVEAYDDCSQNSEAGILSLLQKENEKGQPGNLIE